MPRCRRHPLVTVTPGSKAIATCTLTWIRNAASRACWAATGRNTTLTAEQLRRRQKDAKKKAAFARKLLRCPPGIARVRLRKPSGGAPVARRATVAFVALATADTFLAATGRDRQRRLTKPLLMPMLMIGRDRAGQRALALGWAGDMALLGAGDAAFMAGLASFLASHLAWIAVLRQRHTGGRLRARPALAAPYIAAFGALNAYLWKRTGKDRIPVVVYSTALLAMSLAALDSRSPKAATGGALFLVSDTLLALEKFAAVHLSAHQGLVMAMYAGA